MAVKIRLARHGAKKAPFYRVVVADGRAARDGRFIEMVGRYNPRTEPSLVELDLEKVDAWLAKGAQPTEAVVKIIAIARGEKSAPTAETKVSKKAAEKAKADAEAAAKAAEDAAAAEAAAAAAPVEESSEDAAPVEEAVAEDAPVEEAAEEVVADEAPAEEPADDTTDEDAPAEEAPAEESAE